MPAEILDSNGLAWKASIDYSQIPADIKEIQKLLNVDMNLVNNDAISAEIKKMQNDMSSAMKLIAENEAKNRQEVARLLMESDNQVAANRANIEQEWKAQIQEQIKVLTEYQQQLASVGNSHQPKSIVSTQKIGLDPESVDIIQQAKDMFAQLDQETADVVASLLELNVEYERIQGTMQGLNDQMKAGKIDSIEYAKAVASLAQEEKDVADTIDMIVKQQKDLEAIRKMENGSINQKKAILAQLEEQYNSLAQAEREGATGDQLSKQIQAMSSEIKGLDPKKITEVKEKTVTATQELRKLKQLMATDPGSPLFDEWRVRAGELQESIEEVRNTLALTTSDSAGVDALAEGVRGLVGGFTAVTGAIGFFTEGNEEAEKAIQKTMAALAVLNGVQEISRVLEKESQLNVYLTSLMRKRDAAATVAQTVATTAQTTATTAATTATRSLTAAMMANPALTLVAGITALVGAYLLFRKSSDQVKTSQDLLADATKKVGDRYAEQKAKILPYLEALKSANLTEQQRIHIYNQLASIDGKIVEGLDAKKLSYDLLTTAVNKYLDSLRIQFRLEANQEAITESLKAEEARKKEVDSINSLIEAKQKEVEAAKKRPKVTVGGSTLGVSGSGGNELGELNDLIDKRNKASKAYADQVAVTQDLATSAAELQKFELKANETKKRTVEVIDAEIASLKKKQMQEAVNSKQWKAIQIDIDSKLKEREAITGKEQKKRSSGNKLENELNSLLDKRKSILEAIAGLERDADQSGMLKQASELDRINEKYDQQLAALRKVNEEIEKFNTKNPKNQQELLGKPEITRINAAREIELQNARYKEDAKLYIESLDVKKEAFERFQEALQTGDDAIIQETQNQYKESLEGFTSYTQFLQKEATKIGATLLSNPFSNNIGIVTKLAAINKEIADERIKNDNRAKEQAIKNLQDLVQRTTSINQVRKSIEKKYNDDVALLRSKFTGNELTERLKLLKDQYDQEIDAADRAAFEQTEIFQKMNQDILLFSKKRLQELKKYLEEYLKSNTNLPPAFKKQIEDFVASIQDLLDQGGNVNLVKTFQEISTKAAMIGGALNEMSGAIEGVNEGLASTIQAMSDIAGLASNATNAIAQFAKGDYVAGVAATIQTVTSIFRMGARARESARRAQAEIEAFNLKILLGEMDINAQYRERERIQSQINKLKLEGLEAEQEILKKQKEAVDAQYNSILKQLQQQSYIVTATTERYGGFLGMGRQTRTKLIQEQIGNMTYEQLEKLFNEGRLDGKAKELFEMLQKIKQEGVDIDQMLADNAKAFNELFTGTTSDSILDSIADGFKNGLRSAADFADSFEELMQNAVLNALKYQVLEEPLKEFYAQFAANAQSDDILTEAEIQQLRNNFDRIIGNAGKSFEELQKITNVNFDAVNATRGQGLSGAIKGITEQQAELLAGQFGGLRMTALDAVKVANQQLTVLNDIRYNTGFIEQVRDACSQSNSILKDFQLNGIKVK